METGQILASAMNTIAMALAHCHFYEVIYQSSPAASVDKLGPALVALYAAIIIFAIRSKVFLEDTRGGSYCFSHTIFVDAIRALTEEM